MIDLLQYGFTQALETERSTAYTGHDLELTVFNYPYKTFEGIELARNVFVVNSKQFTSRARPIGELEAWLQEKNIQKT